MATATINYSWYHGSGGTSSDTYVGSTTGTSGTISESGGKYGSATLTVSRIVPKWGGLKITVKAAVASLSSVTGAQAGTTAKEGASAAISKATLSAGTISITVTGTPGGTNSCSFSGGAFTGSSGTYWDNGSLVKGATTNSYSWYVGTAASFTGATYQSANGNLTTKASWGGSYVIGTATMTNGDTTNFSFTDVGSSKSALVTKQTIAVTSVASATSSPTVGATSSFTITVS